jgi:hypothetical protein
LSSDQGDSVSEGVINFLSVTGLPPQQERNGIDAGEGSTMSMGQRRRKHICKISEHVGKPIFALEMMFKIWPFFWFF